MAKGLKGLSKILRAAGLPEGEKYKKGKKAKTSRRKPRPVAEVVLTQNVGRLPKRAMGDRIGRSLAVWDAKVLAHLPLPRAVGPYSAVRYTAVVNSSASNILFGTFKREAGRGNWTDICAVEGVTSSAFINLANNTRYFCLPMDTLDTSSLGTTCCPSALTVQMMNPEALQTTSGILYAGVMSTQAAIEGRAESWDDYFNRFISFQSPRLMSAGKLALKGVQANSYPLNMEPLAEFTRLALTVAPPVVGTLATGTTGPSGWAPILVHNPNNVQMQYLVTVEWRVRFDLTNPASSSHKLHAPTSDATWGHLIKQATSLGHGVVDIAELGARAAQVASVFASL